MDNFAIPHQQPSPANQAGQNPVGLPPRHKIKPEPPKSKSTANSLEALSDAEFDALMEEEMEALPATPPQSDWHLSTLFTGNNPDPFSLPAFEYAKQSLIQNAIILQAMEQAAKQEADEKDSNDTTK